MARNRQPASRLLLAVSEFFLLAHALPIQTQVRPQLEAGLYRPGLAVRLWILNRNVVAQRFMIDAPHPLDDVQRVAVRMAGAVEPGFIVKSDGVADQRVAIPLADGVAHPERRIQKF